MKITKEPSAYFIVEYQQDSFLVNIKKEYDFAIITNSEKLIGFRDVGYEVFGLKKDKWYKVDYRRKGSFSPGETPYDFKQKLIKSKIADSIIKIFIDNHFLDIPERDFGCKPEEYSYDPKDRNPKKVCVLSSHPPMFNVIIFDKLNYSFKEYADVVKMNDCCPGNKDRDIFIKCWNAVTSVK